jgi:hypothetical protein
VTGRLYPIADGMLIAAEEVRRVPRPKHPYLTR